MLEGRKYKVTKPTKKKVQSYEVAEPTNFFLQNVTVGGKINNLRASREEEELTR